MGGGLMQIATYGYQDIYLTGKPQITFFKLIYKRHTHFSMDTLNFSIDNANYGKKVHFVIPKAGDLIYKCFLKMYIPAVSVNSEDFISSHFYEEVAHHIIKSIEIQIGDTVIDKHFTTWFSIWNALTLPKSKELNYNKLIGNYNSSFSALPMMTRIRSAFSSENLGNTYVYLPLQFWFCRFINLALPCSIIKYQDIRFNIEFNTFYDIFSNNDFSNSNLEQVSIDIDYIYLDTDERDRFYNQSHEYLIEQLQFNGKEPLTKQTNIIQLDFKNPIKEIIWVSTNNSSFHQLDFRESLSSYKNPTYSAKILLNDNELFSEKKGRYFSEVQPYQHHTNIPPHSPIIYTRFSQDISYTTYDYYGDNQYCKNGINCYSFALHPEQIQPSGSCNFSKYEKKTLIHKLTDTAYSQGGNEIQIFATSYNILRISDGICELLYN